jgi:hypothetical protein
VPTSRLSTHQQALQVEREKGDDADEGRFMDTMTEAAAGFRYSLSQRR